MSRNQFFLTALEGNEHQLNRLLQSTDVNIQDPRIGYTALHIASAKGHNNCVQLLLKSKAAPDCVTVQDVAPSSKVFDWSGCAGTSPLMMAALFDHMDTVRLLLSAGACPSLRDNRGRTAADLFPADTSSIAEYAECLQERKRREELRERANISQPNAPDATSTNQAGRATPVSPPGARILPDELKVLSLVMQQMNAYVHEMSALQQADMLRQANSAAATSPSPAALSEFLGADLLHLRTVRNQLLATVTARLPDST